MRRKRNVLYFDMSALGVGQYTPKVFGSIIYKLPTRTSWNKSRKEAVRPLAALKRQQKKTVSKKRGLLQLAGLCAKTLLCSR